MGANLCTSKANQTELRPSTNTRQSYDKIPITDKSPTNQENIILKETDEESGESIHDESGRPSITINSANSQASMLLSLNSPIHTKTNSNYNPKLLLNTINIMSDQNICNINNCLPIKQLLLIIQYHMNENNFIETNYDITTILNNFYHILNEHNNNQFEILYNYIINNLYPNSQLYNFCDIQTCKSIQRLYSNNSYITTNKNEEINDIILIEIMDIIHCYILHSFDIGYKLNNNEYKNIQFDIFIDEKCNQFEIENYVKHTKYKNIFDIQETKINYGLTKYKNNRFITKLEQNYECINAEISPEFYYWNYYKLNEKKWYINGRYGNLKEEILSNDINKNEWNLLYEKANIYVCTHYMLSLKANGEHLKYYNIQLNDIITLNHIISLLLYCNYTKFCNQLRNSFVRENINENDESFINRHSFYVNISKYLTEICQCFGDKIMESNCNNYYHGVNFNVLMTQDIIGEFMWNAPVSTTSNFEVMALYLHNGLICENDINDNIDDTNILVLNGCEFDIYTKYFNCSFLSKYPNETEQIFKKIGTKERLIVNTIIDGLKGYDYKLYIMALNIIYYVLNGKGYKYYNPNMIVMKYVINTLFNQNINKKIPKIIVKLFDKYREEMVHMKIDLCVMNKMEIKNDMNDSIVYGYQVLKNVFIDVDMHNFIDLNKCNELFPNLKEITIFGNDQKRNERVALLPDLIKSLLIDLNRMNKLVKIMIVNPREKKMAIINTLETYKAKYKDIGWDISVKRRNEKCNNISVCRNILTLVKIK